MWERGDKTNQGIPELNASSVGMAKVTVWSCLFFLLCLFNGFGLVLILRGLDLIWLAYFSKVKSKYEIQVVHVPKPTEIIGKEWRFPTPKSACA